MAREVVLCERDERRVVATIHGATAAVQVYEACPHGGGMVEDDSITLSLSETRALAEAAGLVVLDADQVRALVEWRRAHLCDASEPRRSYGECQAAALAVAESLRSKGGE